MGARSGVGNLEYSADREESKNFKLSRTYCSKKKNQLPERPEEAGTPVQKLI